MKKFLFIAAVFAGALVCFSFEELKAEEQEVIVCPGKGERCYRAEFLGVPIWWTKKEKGGPGVIVVE